MIIKIPAYKIIKESSNILDEDHEFTEDEILIDMNIGTINEEVCYMQIGGNKYQIVKFELKQLAFSM